MAKKYCPKCKTTKNIIDFYKNKARYDGLSSLCKYCDNKRGKIKDREWYKKNKNKKIKYAIKFNKEYRLKILDKEKIRNKSKQQVRIGNIKREKCQICGDVKTEFHHNDYNNPFSLYHLCRKCHKKVHTGELKLNIFPYNYRRL